MLLGALLELRLSGAGLHPSVAWLAAMLLGAVLGVGHVSVLKLSNPSILMVCTVVAHVILNEAWLAFPGKTGGSGGILVEGGWHIYLVGFLMLLACHGSADFISRSRSRYIFSWAALRYLGPDAGVLGVRADRLFLVAFASYGVVLAAGGVLATHFFGYLAPSSYSLALSLVIVMITLAGSRSGLHVTALLCLFYAFARVILRQSIYASSFWSNTLDLVFPLSLFWVVLQRNKESNVMAPHLVPQNPFYGGEDSVPIDKFVGREDLAFLERYDSMVGGGGLPERTDNVWVFVGRKSFGKSCIRRWFKERAANAVRGRVLVCDMTCDNLWASGITTMKDFLGATLKQIQSAFAESACEKKAQWPLWWFFADPRAGMIRRYVFSVVEGLSKGSLRRETLDILMFFENLRRLCRFAKSGISTIVLVFDEVRAGDPALAEILHRLSIEVYRGDRWNPRDPSLLFVYLPLPGWDKDVGEARDRRMKVVPLGFFSILDMERYFGMQEGLTSWQFEKGVAAEMFQLTGGQPYLFQMLGWQACETLKSQKADPVLTISAIKAASAQDSVQRAVGTVVTYGFELAAGRLVPSEVQMISTFATPTSQAAFDGMTKEEWLEVLSAVPLSEGDAENVFEGLWPRLTGSGLLRRIDDHPPRYRFSGELVRRWLGRLARQ